MSAAVELVWLVWLGIGVPAGAVAAWVWRDWRWLALGFILGPAVVAASLMYRTTPRAKRGSQLTPAVAELPVAQPEQSLPLAV